MALLVDQQDPAPRQRGTVHIFSADIALKLEEAQKLRQQATKSGKKVIVTDLRPLFCQKKPFSSATYAFLREIKHVSS